MVADNPENDFRADLAGLISAVILAGVLVIYGYWTDTPVSRYQSHPEHYEMIFRQEGDVDLAALGSSRLMSFFKARAMSEALEKRAGRPVVVYDLSKAWIGNGITQVMLEDLFKRRRVERVLVEFKYTNGLYNPTFYEIATFRDIVDGHLVHGGRPFYIRGQEALRLTANKMIRQSVLWLKGERRSLEDLPTRPARTTEVREFHPVHSAKVRLARERMAGTWRQTPAVEWPLGEPRERRNEYYLQRICDLSRAHGAEPVFVYLPVIYGPLLTGDMVERVERRFGVRFFQPPRELLADVYTRGFADTYHANPYGAALVTGWLAGELYGRE